MKLTDILRWFRTDTKDISQKESNMEYQYLLVGLGNPGAKYHGTRHNMGFQFLDYYMEHCAIKGRVEELSGTKFKCELWRVKENSSAPWRLLAKPQTFMNVSGVSVQPLLAWHKLTPQDLIVVHDELDIPPGQLRFKLGGGNAGHNGLKSITQHLGTPDFYRMRLGIGRPTLPEHGDVANFVLSCPKSEEQQHLENAMPKALEVLDIFENEGLKSASKHALTVKE